LAEYASVVSERNIFHPFEKKVIEEKAAAEEVVVPNQKIKSKMVDFKIVGISWLDTPQSATVMIEDTKTQITHFLRAGENLQGVQVKTIYADRVILSYEGETLAVNL
jgi:type II secretory pathway component PulC